MTNAEVPSDTLGQLHTGHTLKLSSDVLFEELDSQTLAVSTDSCTVLFRLQKLHDPSLNKAILFAQKLPFCSKCCLSFLSHSYSDFYLVFSNHRTSPQFQSPCHGQGLLSPEQAAQTLNASTDWADKISPGNLFQWLTSTTVIFSPITICNVNRLSFSLYPVSYHYML